MVRARSRKEVTGVGGEGRIEKHAARKRPAPVNSAGPILMRAFGKRRDAEVAEEKKVSGFQ